MPRDSPTRVGFFGVLGSGNIGNDCSLDAIVGYLRERHPDVPLDFFVMAPEEVSARYGATATALQWFEAHMEQLSAVPDVVLKVVGRLLDPFRTLRWVRRQDAVIVPGMGVLEGTTPLRPWGFPFGLLGLAAACRLAGKDLLLVSVGADVISKRASRRMVTTSARWARYRSYRDTTSRDAMRAMGVDVSGDRIYPDLAFWHAVPDWKPDGTRTVGLGLMDYQGNNDERDRAAELHRHYVAQMKRFARWLVDDGRPIRFFTCDPMDRVVIDEVKGDLRAYRPDLGPAMLIDERQTDLTDLMHEMEGVDAVVATRYHNVISAVKMSIPTLSVGYGAKHDDLMQRVGLGAFCQQARAADADRMIEQFRALEREQAELVAAMEEHNRENVAGVDRQLTELSTVLFDRAPRRQPGRRAPEPSRT